MGGPRRTTSGSSSTSVVVPVEEAVEQLLQGTADIGKLRSSEIVMGFIVTILGQLLKIDRENNKLKERIAVLEKKNEEQDRKIADFELRLFKMKQYSSRSTAIMTGVPANDNENTAEIVCKNLNDVDKDITFSPCDLSHCHRNWTNRTNRPPTITVVFNRSYDKDLVMRKSTRDKLKARRFNIHHHMGNTVLSEFRRLSDRTDVKWVQYLGHRSNFSVKMNNDDYIRNVLNSDDLDSKLLKLTQ